MSLDDLAPIPTIESATLAIKFASIAISDAKVARILHRNRSYPQSIFALQQSVEKSSKGFALLMEIVGPDPKDLKYLFSHKPLVVLLERSADFLGHIYGSYLRITEIALDDYPTWGRKVFEEVRTSAMVSGQLLPKPEQLRAAGRGLASARASEMWLATLNLDRRVRQVDDAILAMKQNVLDSAYLRFVLKTLTFPMKRKMTKNRDYPGYVLLLIQALSRIYPLNFLTMWHEQSTRYPPTQPSDFWTSEAYTSRVPLVKKLPELCAQAERLSGDVFKAATSAVRISAEFRPALQEWKRIRSTDEATPRLPNP
jgi:hypothetical protein